MGYPGEYDEMEHFLEDPEGYCEWFAEENQREHTCEACKATFKSHRARGKLSYCDSCTDKLERGEDIYY